jgi:hypothetical protein
MDLHPDFRDRLAEFAREKVSYAVVGGYAVGHHAKPRATKDLDLLVSPSGDNLERVARALANFGAAPNVVDAVRRLAPTEVVSLRHELAHQLSAFVYPHQSRWFCEGLAEFLETTHRTSDGTAVVLGEANRAALLRLQSGPGVSIRDVLEWGESATDIGIDKSNQLYGKSWWLGGAACLASPFRTRVARPESHGKLAISRRLPR